jgi:hypothetical protein
MGLAVLRGSPGGGAGRSNAHGAAQPPVWQRCDDLFAEQHGVGYKLGYTTGVNVCGAIFFGFFFWRLNRWRKSTLRRPD